MYGDCFRQTSRGDVVISRLLYGLAGFDLSEMTDQQLKLDRIGMVKIDQLPLCKRDIGVVSIVLVLRNDSYLLLSEFLQDTPDYGSFA